jgi:hypothetical protein
VSTRVAAWLAWSLAALNMAMFLASAALYVLALSAQSPSNWITIGTVSEMLGFVPFLAFPIVGALITSRRPQNPIGWICLADGILWSLLGMTDYYTRYAAQVCPDARPVRTKGVVDKREELVSRSVYLFEVRAESLPYIPVRDVLQKHFAVADDGVQGCAQLVAEVGEQGSPGPLGSARMVVPALSLLSGFVRKRGVAHNGAFLSSKRASILPSKRGSSMGLVS